MSTRDATASRCPRSALADTAGFTAPTSNAGSPIFDSARASRTADAMALSSPPGWLTGGGPGQRGRGRCRRHPSPAGHGDGRTTSYGLWNLAWLARPAELAFTVEVASVLHPFSTERPTRSPTRSAVERVELPLAPQPKGFPALRVLDHPHPPLTSSEWRVRVVEPTPGQVFRGCGASGSSTECGCDVVGEGFGVATGGVVLLRAPLAV